MVQTYFQLKSKFVAREVGGELVVVPLTGNIAHMNELFTFNATAKLLWEELGPESTEASLAKALLDTYEVDEATAAADVKKFLARLEEMAAKY
ncbi:MAG: PqqD family protein [Paludibacter sp.]|jgi:malonyl CoA-acyl carrier protein transacylase|nr:PqqD family protein [Paludibacter sp.]